MPAGGHVPDDPLDRLAAALRRPRESLTGFAGLTPAQLTLLTGAIDATLARRTAEIDSELARALSPNTAPIAARLLRSHGIPPLRRLLIGRDG